MLRCGPSCPGDPRQAGQRAAAVPVEPSHRETLNFTSVAEGTQLKFPHTVLTDPPVRSRAFTSADP